MRSFGIIILIILFTYALYCIVQDIIGIPSSKSSSLIWNYDKPTKKSATGYSAFINRGAYKLCKYINIEEYRRENMQRALILAGYAEEYTPEEFLATKVLNCIVHCLISVIFLFIMPIFTLILCSGECIKLYKSITNLNKLLDEQTKAIDQEMVNFVQTIRQEVVKDRDVYKCLEAYSKYASRKFKIELDKTLAMMQNGEYEKALIELDRRVNSNQLGQVTRALISVIHGSNASYTFDMLCSNFEATQENQLDILAEETGDKTERYAVVFIFLVAFLFLTAFGLFAFMEYKKSGVSL